MVQEKTPQMCGGKEGWQVKQGLFGSRAGVTVHTSIEVALARHAW